MTTTGVTYNHKNSQFWQLDFTGKERDPETGYSYFGSRYLENATLTLWLSVDPMADKYPSISPYAYCAWNPLKLVDPNGDDIWELNENGELIWKESSTTDVIRAANGKYVIVNEGVLTKGHSYTKKDDGFFTLNFDGDIKNATEVFEFMSDHSNVEFSLIGYAVDKDDKESTHYYLTTSFNNRGDSHGSQLALNISIDGKMRLHKHNHPSRDIKPSNGFTNGGLAWPGAPIKEGNDVEFANLIKEKSPSCMFYIYGHNAQGYNGDYYRPYYGAHSQGIPSYKAIKSNVIKNNQYTINK